MSYESVEFEFYLYNKETGEGDYQNVRVVEYQPAEIGNDFHPDYPEDFTFEVVSFSGSRLVYFHYDPYSEYNELVKECKRLAELFGEDYE